MPESGPAGVFHPSWRRVVLKLSGGLFAGSEPLGISPDVVAHLAAEIIAAVKDGVQVAAVVGGGNMFRGKALAERGIDRARADYMGMLTRGDRASPEGGPNGGGSSRTLRSGGMQKSQRGVEAGHAADEAGRGNCNGPEALKRPAPGRTGTGSGAEGSNGQGIRQATTRSSRLETSIPESGPCKGQRLWGSEKPLRASGPVREKYFCGVSESFDPIAGKTSGRGADRRSVRCS